MGRFSQYNEDAYRLPEGMQRVAYDADTQCYTFQDCSGQLYQSAPGEEYGVLEPISVAPLPRRRDVIITEIHDPTLRRWSSRPAKTFDDILPSGYITVAQSPVKSRTSMRFSIDKWVQVVVAIVRRRTMLKKPVSGVRRSELLVDEKSSLFKHDAWEAVHKEEIVDGRGVAVVGHSKSEKRTTRYCWRK